MYTLCSVFCREDWVVNDPFYKRSKEMLQRLSLKRAMEHMGRTCVKCPCGIYQTIAREQDKFVEKYGSDWKEKLATKK